MKIIHIVKEKKSVLFQILKSEIKNADNEENIVKAEFRR